MQNDSERAALGSQLIQVPQLSKIYFFVSLSLFEFLSSWMHFKGIRGKIHSVQICKRFIKGKWDIAKGSLCHLLEKKLNVSRNDIFRSFINFFPY